MLQAVLCGVNIYRDHPGDTLRGCLNDVANLRRLLVNELGFKQGEVLALADSKAIAATEKAAVLSRIVAMGPGDRLVWSHSSHGSNNPDPSQKDGLQELLCCYDIQEKDGLWDEDTVITARWIGEAIAKLHPQASMDIFLDCCNAPEGSQLKAMGRRYDCAKFLPRRLLGMPVKPTTNAAREAGLPKNVCLWSACEPAQTSADAFIDDQWQGAFSAALTKSFKKGRTRSDIIYYTRKWLKENGYRQTPHLYGSPGMTGVRLG